MSETQSFKLVYWQKQQVVVPASSHHDAVTLLPEGCTLESVNVDGRPERERLIVDDYCCRCGRPIFMFDGGVEEHGLAEDPIFGGDWAACMKCATKPRPIEGPVSEREQDVEDRLP